MDLSCQYIFFIFFNTRLSYSFEKTVTLTDFLVVIVPDVIVRIGGTHQIIIKQVSTGTKLISLSRNGVVCSVFLLQTCVQIDY